MATPRKIRQFFDVTELSVNYTGTIRAILGPITLGMLSRGDLEEGLCAQFQEKFIQRVKPMLLQRLEKVIGEMMTDADLDELMAIYRLPVQKKAREMLPHIQQEVSNLLLDGDVDFQTIAAEVLSELE